MLLILIGLVAAAGAAPNFPFSDETSLEMFNDDRFSMSNFRQQLIRHIRNSPHVETEEVEGNEYKIEIPLTGFQKSDISVKYITMLGMSHVEVEAVHLGTDITCNVITKNLPDYVGANHHWTYEDGILKIVFPINNNANEGSDQQKEQRILKDDYEFVPLSRY